MINANPLSDVFTSVSRACDGGAINKLAGFLFVTTLTATLTLTAAAQTNNFQEAAAQTPTFKGWARCPEP